MSGKDITYEKSLETMNESMLRAECIRLHDEYLIAIKKLLTQPVPGTRGKEEVKADLDRLIE